MIYSVFNYDQRRYDYFEAPGVPPAVGKMRTPVGPLNKPECLAVRLPAGAVAAGSGELPRGCIAASSSGLGALEGNGAPGFGWLTTGALALGAFLVGRRWGRR